MVYSEAWDEANPVDSTDADTIDDEIRSLKIALRERLEDLIDDWTNDGVDPKTFNSTKVFEALTGALDRAKVDRSVAQSIPDGTATKITWENEVYDVGGLVDIGTNPTRITAQTGGTYRVTAYISWVANVNGYRIIRVLKNGTTLVEDVRDAASKASGQLGMLTVFEGNLLASDYLEVEVEQNSTAALDVSTGSYLAVILIG